LQASLLNALDHCLEGIVSIRRSPMTDASYLHAIRLLQSSSTLDSAAAIIDAQAGAALSSMYLVPMGLAHALAHVVGGRYRTPHALTHGLVAAPVMRFNRSIVAKQQRMIADAFYIPTGDHDDEWAATRAIEAVDELVHRMGAPIGLRGLGVPESGLRELAQMAISDHNAATNPRPVGPDEAYEVLRWAWSGEFTE
jgi:alcohol dehydrogenase class IV